jgi:hypothetical protein
VVELLHGVGVHAEVVAVALADVHVVRSDQMVDVLSQRSVRCRLLPGLPGALPSLPGCGS